MEEIDIKELFDYFKSKVLWIAIILVSSIIIGNIYTLITRVPEYKSNASIVLVSENKDSNPSYNNSEQQLNKNLVGTYSQIIKSKTVLEKVIENLKLKLNYNQLKNKITVQAVENTEIIEIYVTDKNAEDATKIANETSKVFVDEINKFYKLNNVTILDEAVDATKPYNVNLIKDNAIYSVIGIVLSCGLIFIVFYFDSSVKTVDEIENKIGLTVIGSVPKVGKESL